MIEEWDWNSHCDLLSRRSTSYKERKRQRDANGDVVDIDMVARSPMSPVCRNVPKEVPSSHHKADDAESQPEVLVFNKSLTTTPCSLIRVFIDPRVITYSTI